MGRKKFNMDPKKVRLMWICESELIKRLLLDDFKLQTIKNTQTMI